MKGGTPEEREELACRQLFTLAGIDVCKISQGVRGHFDQAAGAFVVDRGGTRQTRGIADLELWIPTAAGGLVLGKWETKTAQGLKEFEALRRRSLSDIMKNAPSRLEPWTHVQEQLLYAARCLQAGVVYGRGGMPEAWRLLLDVGLAKQVHEDSRHPPVLVRANRYALQHLADVVRDGRPFLPPALDGEARA